MEMLPSQTPRDVPPRIILLDYLLLRKKEFFLMEGGEAVLRKVGSKHESGGESVAPSDLVRPEEQNH